MGDAQCDVVSGVSNTAALTSNDYVLEYVDSDADSGTSVASMPASAGALQFSQAMKILDIGSVEGWATWSWWVPLALGGRQGGWPRGRGGAWGKGRVAGEGRAASTCIK